MLGALPDAASGVHYLRHSPDGARVAAGLADAKLEPWKADTAEVLLRLDFTAGVFFTSWTKDGQGLFALPMDDTVRFLRGPSGGE